MQQSPVHFVPFLFGAQFPIYIDVPAFLSIFSRFLFHSISFYCNCQVVAHIKSPKLARDVGDKEKSTDTSTHTHARKTMAGRQISSKRVQKSESPNGEKEEETKDSDKKVKNEINDRT